MEEIEKGITIWNEKHGQGTLEKVILPNEEFEAFEPVLRQKYPHIQFEGDDIDGLIFIHTDPD